MSMGEALRDARLRQNITMRGLARTLGVSRAFLYEIERNETNPSDERLEQLATALNLNPDDLLLLAGRIPNDVTAIILNNPSLLTIIRNHSTR